MKRQILVRVRQGELSPGQALNLIQDEYLRDGTNRRLWPRKVDESLFHVLEALHQKAITVTVSKEEIEERIIKWSTAKRKRKTRIKNQTEGVRRVYV